MTDDERKQRAYDLKAVLDSPGGQILLQHIEEEIRDGWETFIALPVDKKTSKAAFAAQAQYKALKGIKEWIEGEIRVAGIE